MEGLAQQLHEELGLLQDFGSSILHIPTSHAWPHGQKMPPAP